MTKKFSSLIDQLPQLLDSLQPIDWRAIPAKEKRAGVYVFYEKNKPIYVGRTKNLKQRIRSHYCKQSHNKSSFVFLMACDTFGRKKASYKKQDGRKELFKDPVFREKHYLKAHERLAKMKLRFVEIPDPKLQHLFEIYAAMVLGTEKYNSFDTH